MLDTTTTANPFGTRAAAAGAAGSVTTAVDTTDSSECNTAADTVVDIHLKPEPLDLEPVHFALLDLQAQILEQI